MTGFGSVGLSPRPSGLVFVPKGGDSCPPIGNPGTSDLSPAIGDSVPGAESSLSAPCPPIEGGGRGQRGGARWVYVIGNADSRLVKIGTSRDVAQRLSNLQIGSPSPLHLIMCVRTNAFAERALHEHFAANRRHGEWFDFGSLDPATEVCFAIGQIGTTPEVARRRGAPRVRLAQQPVDRYVAALIDAGAPAGCGRAALKQWARQHGVPLPGKTEALCAVVAAFKATRTPNTEKK